MAFENLVVQVDLENSGFNTKLQETKNAYASTIADLQKRSESLKTAMAAVSASMDKVLASMQNTGKQTGLKQLLTDINSLKNVPGITQPAIAALDNLKASLNTYNVGTIQDALTNVESRLSQIFAEINSDLTKTTVEQSKVITEAESFAETAERLKKTGEDGVTQITLGGRTFFAVCDNGIFKLGTDISGIQYKVNEVVEQSTNKAKSLFAEITAEAKTVAKSFASVMGVGITANVFKTVVDEAAKAQKANLALAATFNEISDAAQYTAESLAESYGLSNAAAENLLATSGNILKANGMDQQTALQMSETLAKLGSDYSAFFGYTKTAEEAVSEFTQILVGNYRNAREFGIAMSEDVVERIANAYGKQADELSNLELIYYRYLAVLDQASNVSGAFQANQDSYLIQVNLLKSALSDLAATVGSSLIPVLTTLVHSITDVVNAFASLSTVGRTAIATLAIGGTAVSALTKIYKTVRQIDSALKVANISAKALKVSLSWVAAIEGVMLAVAGLVDMAKKARDTAAAVDDLHEALEKVGEVGKDGFKHVTLLSDDAQAALQDKLDKIGHTYSRNVANLEIAQGGMNSDDNIRFLRAKVATASQRASANPNDRGAQNKLRSAQIELETALQKLEASQKLIDKRESEVEESFASIASVIREYPYILDELGYTFADSDLQKRAEDYAKTIIEAKEAGVDLDDTLSAAGYTSEDWAKKLESATTSYANSVNKILDEDGYYRTSLQLDIDALDKEVAAYNEAIEAAKKYATDKVAAGIGTWASIEHLTNKIQELANSGKNQTEIAKEIVQTYGEIPSEVKTSLMTLITTYVDTYNSEEYYQKKSKTLWEDYEYKVKKASKSIADSIDSMSPFKSIEKDLRALDTQLESTIIKLREAASFKSTMFVQGTYTDASGNKVEGFDKVQSYILENKGDSSKLSEDALSAMFGADAGAVEYAKNLVQLYQNYWANIAQTQSDAVREMQSNWGEKYSETGLFGAVSSLFTEGGWNRTKKGSASSWEDEVAEREKGRKEDLANAKAYADELGITEEEAVEQINAAWDQIDSDALADVIEDSFTKAIDQLSSLIDMFGDTMDMFSENNITTLKNNLAETEEHYDELKELMDKRNEENTENLTVQQKDALKRQEQMDQEELERLEQQMEDQEALIEEEERKQFERQKKIDIAQTIISGLTGAMDAYKSMAGIPYVGPALGIAAAAAVAAFSAAQVAAISAQEYPSYAVGAYDLPQDQMAQVHKGEMIIPKPFAEEIRDNGGFGSGEIIVNVYGATDEVSVEENNSDNTQQVDIYLTNRVKQMVARGELDSSLQSRYAISMNGRRS